MANPESSNVDEIVNIVRRFILRRDFNEGRAFIQSLDEPVASLPAVAYVCGSFYNLLGHPKLAEESLQTANYESLIAEEGAYLDECVAVVALLAARIRIRRYFEYANASAISRRIEDIYVNLQTLEPFQPSQRDRYDYIKRQAHLWSLSAPEEYNDKEAPISDMRVFIEVELFELMQGAVEAGFMLDEELTRKLRARIPPLLAFLQSNQRHYPAAICFFLTDVGRISSSPLQFAESILAYLESVRDEDDNQVLCKACALSRLAQYLLRSNPNSARLYFDDSLALFARQNCSSHLADLDLVRIQDFEKSSSPDDRLHQLSELIRRCRALGCAYLQLTAGRLILDVITNDLWVKAKAVIQEMEDDLDSVGDSFRLMVFRIVKWRKLAWHLQEVESSRLFLSQTLEEHCSQLTPDMYGAVCEGLYRSYLTLGDFASAVKYGELEVSSDAAKLPKSRLSDAQLHLANARMSQLIHSIDLIGNNVEQADERKNLIANLLQVTLTLEQWADLDLQEGRHEGRRSKGIQLVLCYNSLNRISANQSYAEKIKFWGDENQPNKGSDATPLFVATRVVHLVSLQKFEDAFEYAEQATKNILTDPNFTGPMRSATQLLIIITMDGAYPMIKSKSLDQAKEWRQRQFRLLLEDTKQLYLDRSTELLLVRVSIMCWVARDYVEFFPHHREACLKFMAQYFLITDKMCYDLRHSLKADVGIRKLLRKRMINAKVSIRNFYEHAAEFFLQVGNETRAWYWMQRKRGQALIDLLAERTTAQDQVQSLLENNLDIGPMLEKEDVLVRNVASADIDRISSALEDLSQHRDEMKKVPTLMGLMDNSAYPKPDEWNDLKDIWSLSEYLPEGTNIVLVDWIVTPMNDIYWISKNLKEKGLSPRHNKLTIGHLYIDRWIAKYLRFPHGLKCPLEINPKAIWLLQYLLAGLETICNPGDLVILTPPARFAALPIHAICMDGKAWIERNPIIYSSSFSLYRECLKRSRLTSQSLSNSIFTSVYEEPGEDKEWGLIKEQVTASASLFGGRTILGTDLTKQAFQTALKSAPWMHYHGHAHYEHSEALQQCFILSNGSMDETQIAVDELASNPNTAADPEEVFLEELGLDEIRPVDLEAASEAVLSSYLLKNSSQLTVSDIFTLNLSENHPFVCNIACHSGMQDVAAGDEPLGLVTALFCAGASSVLGTLWPIKSDMGRSFTKHFYESIEKQRKPKGFKEDERVIVLNLAFAVRDAALQVKKERSDPYSWAAFVLHGAGLLTCKR